MRIACDAAGFADKEILFECTVTNGKNCAVFTGALKCIRLNPAGLTND